MNQEESLKDLQGNWKNKETGKTINISGMNITLENGQMEKLEWAHQDNSWIILNINQNVHLSINNNGELSYLLPANGPIFNGKVFLFERSI